MDNPSARRNVCFVFRVFQQAAGLKPDGAQAVMGNGLQALQLQPGAFWRQFYHQRRILGHQRLYRSQYQGWVPDHLYRVQFVLDVNQEIVNWWLLIKLFYPYFFTGD